MCVFQVTGTTSENETQETTGMTAFEDLGISPETVTSTSSSVEPSEAPAILEHSPSQEERSPAARAASPATTQLSHDTDTAEETDLPPESG